MPTGAACSRWSSGGAVVTKPSSVRSGRICVAWRSSCGRSRKAGVGNSSAIQFESGIETFPGTHSNFIVIGDMDNRVATTYVPDRRRISTAVRIGLYHAAFNFDELDLYIVESGTSIDDVNRTLPLVYSLLTPTLIFEEGSWDIYVTESGEKNVIGGPLTVTPSVGETLELLVLDTVDPAVAEIRLIPPP